MRMSNEIVRMPTTELQFYTPNTVSLYEPKTVIKTVFTETSKGCLWGGGEEGQGKSY